jgi:hypothetical protein
MIARDLLAAFALTRGALVAIAVLSAATIPYGIACAPCDLSSVPILNALGRWDAGFYLSIARDGYSFEPDARSNVAFAPLLPLLMRTLAAAVGRSDDDALLAAGILVSNVALVLAIVALAELGRDETDAPSAKRAAFYLLVFPTTIFLSTVYPASLFIAAGAGSLVAARRGRWWWAGAFAALGALARPFGAVLVVPLAVEWALGGRAIRRWDALALGIPLVAFAGWAAYLYRLSGDPLLFLTAQRAFGRRAAPPWEGIQGLFDPAQYGSPWIVLATFAAMAALVALSWRSLRPATATCATVLLLATASSGTLTSFPRYALEIFPAFLVLGALGRDRRLHLAYVCAATVLAALLTAMFAAWYWIG